MKITKKTLEAAVKEEILDADQAGKLYQFLDQHPGHGSSDFNFTNILYYLGGMIAIGAMTLFMNLGWESFGGWGIFFISLAYAGIGFKLTELFQNKAYAVPAGICATFVVALTPLAIYGLQQGLGVWPDSSVYREYYRYIKWHWIYMELGTLAVGIIMVWKYRYPFLIMPVAFTLWYLSMDAAVMIAENADFEFRAMVSLCFGMLMILLAFWTELRSRKEVDYAFWLYIFGVITFLGGLVNCQFEFKVLVSMCLGVLMVLLALLRDVRLRKTGLDYSPLLYTFGVITLWLSLFDEQREFNELASICFGLLIILLAFLKDVRLRKTKKDFSNWLYIFGVITFWVGITSQHSDSELSRFIYFCINLLMIGIGAALVRRVFVIFGAIGASLYLGYLAHNIFADSWFFPIALTAIGFMIIYSGVLWEKNEKQITEKVRSMLPPALRELLEYRAR